MTYNSTTCDRCGILTVGSPVAMGYGSLGGKAWLCGLCYMALRRWLRTRPQ